MKISTQEERFLKTALRMGYLHPEQAAEACEGALASGTNVIRFLAERGILSIQQIEQILKIATSTGHVPKIPPQDRGKGREREDRETGEQAKPGDGSKPLDVLSQQIREGAVWGDFEILEQIGKGGMGVVYRARERKSEKIVAIKITITGNETQNRRFLREARACTTLQHPDILPVYSVGQQGGYSYFVMKYIRGNTYSDLLREGAPLEKRLEIVIRVAKALHYAHQQKIVHRDIKPSNILLDEAGGVFLSDFGLAKFLDQESRLTQSGQILGTPFYMAPEQLQGTKEKNLQRSDIYSLGVVLYQSITDRLPFLAPSFPSLYHMIINDPPVPPCEVNPEISPALQAICLKAMDKSPSLRYSHASEMAFELERFRKAERVDALRFDFRKAAVETYRYFTRSPWLLLAFVSAAALLVGAIFWTMSGGEWKAHWRDAEKAFEAGDHRLAWQCLDRIQGHPPERVESFRSRISRKVLDSAQIHRDAGDCGRALLALESIPRDSAESLLLRAHVLEEMGRAEEMRLALTRLFEQESSVEGLRAMAALALRGGYFADARKYLDAALAQDAQSADLRLEAGFASLLQNDYRHAAKCYSGLKDARAAWGMGLLYHEQGEHLKALETLEDIGDSELTPYFLAQKSFVRACALWKIAEPELTRLNWLSGSRTEFPELLRIESLLTDARGKIDACPRPAHLEKDLRKKIDWHLAAIGLEQKIETSANRTPESLEREVREGDMPTHMRIFFLRVLSRFLARNRLWAEARTLCDRAAKDYPWEAEFWHIHSLARFYGDEIEESLADLEKSIRLDRWNFVPLENMSVLMYSRMAHLEYNEFSLKLVNRFVMRPPPLFPNLVFSRCLEEVRELVRQDEAGAARVSGESANQESLLGAVVSTPSESVLQVALDILAAQAENPELQSRVREMKAKAVGEQVKSRLDRLEQAMREKQKLQALAELERTLLRYAVLNEKRYLLDVYRMGSLGESMLREILVSSKRRPFVRFLAAKMLAATGRETSCGILAHEAEKSPWPLNLLASVALKEKGIAVELPSPEKSEVLSGDPRDSAFYRILLALHISPKNPELARSLLDDTEKLVSLCAAYNLRRYADLPSGIASRDIEMRLLAMCRSQEPHIRGLACQVFWNFDDIASDQGENGRESYRLECWRRYHESYLASLQDPISQVQFAAGQAMLRETCFEPSGNMRFRKSGIESTPSREKFIEILRARYVDSPYFMKFWSGVLLSMIDETNSVIERIESPEDPFFIRMGCARGLFISRSDIMEMVSLSLKILQSECKSESDVFFQQTALFLIGWNFTSGWFRNVAPPMLDTFRSFVERKTRASEPSVQAAAISALLWCGQKRSIDTVLPCLDAPDRHVQRAAAGTLASLTSRYRQAELPDLQRRLRTREPHIRKAAAYGYYEWIWQELNVPYERMSQIDYDDRYQLGLLYFQHRMSSKDDASLRFWGELLRNAADLDPSFEHFYESALVSREISRRRGARDRFAEAFSLLGKALEMAEISRPSGESIDRRKMHGLLLLGEMSIQIGQEEEASRAFERLIREYPLHPRARFYLGRAAAMRGNAAEARGHFWESCAGDREFFELSVVNLREGRELAYEILARFPKK